MLFISGTPGLTQGHLQTFEGQAERALAKVIAMLQKASVGPEHLVKVSQYLIGPRIFRSTSRFGRSGRGKTNRAFLPAAVPGLVREDCPIEIEAIAVAPQR